MDFDIFHTDILKLSKYNVEIRDVCSNYTYNKDDGEYDLDAGKISKWFDPEFQKILTLSQYYPEAFPYRDDPRFNLILYFANYASLFVINKLYEDRRDILIEDIASGMGKLDFYLSKLGFSNFSLLDNCTQICSSAIFDLMDASGAEYTLNKLNTSPTVINIIGWVNMVRQDIPSSVELVCVYNNNSIIRGNKNFTPTEDILSILKGEGDYAEDDDKYYETNLKYIGHDSYNMVHFYARPDKYVEFIHKLKVP